MNLKKTVKKFPEFSSRHKTFTFKKNFVIIIKAGCAIQPTQQPGFPPIPASCQTSGFCNRNNLLQEINKMIL